MRELTMEQLTPQEKIWIDALEKLAPKAKQLGWSLPPDGGQDDIVDGGVFTFALLDPKMKKHWFQIDANGNVSPAPTAMVYRGTNQMVI